jgi:hypothetical protein
MSRYRDQAIKLVADMREIWPSNVDESTLDQRTINVVSQIKDKLISYIVEMGAPNRIVNKIMGANNHSDDPGSRRDLEYQDAIQQFWFGVVNGLAQVKSRISPDGQIDINDPLEFLIAKGKWAVLDMKRSANLKRLVQTCHICNSTHKLFRPNISSLAFDETLCLKIRGGTSVDGVAEYRKKLLLEKIKRSPIKNPCKECYNSGVKDWYPVYGPSVVGTYEFEKDLDSIDFMIFSVDTDVVEIFMSNDVNTDDEEINFIENTACSIFNDDIVDIYAGVNTEIDGHIIKNIIIYQEDDDLYGYIYDVVYGKSMDPCKICPRRGKLLVESGKYTYRQVKLLTTQIMCGSSEDICLGDWEVEYKSAEACGGLPMNDCDNLNARIANMCKTHIPKIREIRKVIDNRYGAYLAVDQIISEAMELLHEKASR